jgi:hypothetical protein
VLDRSEPAPKLIEVKSATQVKDHYLDDCAIQAWALERNGHAPRQVAVATIDTSFIYPGGGRYEGLLRETDVTDAVRARVGAVPQLVADARRTLADLDEPAVAVGTHCNTPHGCQFLAHCSPPAAPAPAPAPAGKGRVGGELRDLVRTLPYPRFYLDFETIAPAVPIFAGTRPFEQLPFQWSCHIETAPGALAHAEFLDLGAAAPMRRLAESLLATLGTTGPIVVYTSFERGVLNGLAARFTDLAAPLAALAERLVDLYPPTKRHYEHPALQGSWSLKAVLPTVAPDLRYSSLAEVQDGLAAQSAYFEAIASGTPADRRATLERALRDYCRHDTLALARLVAFFGG